MPPYDKAARQRYAQQKERERNTKRQKPPEKKKVTSTEMEQQAMLIETHLSGNEGEIHFTVFFPNGISAIQSCEIARFLMAQKSVRLITDNAPNSTTEMWRCVMSRGSVFDASVIAAALYSKGCEVHHR